MSYFPFIFFVLSTFTPLSSFSFVLCPSPCCIPSLFLIALNAAAAGVTSGPVFCGRISGICATFTIWIVLEASFTAPAVMLQCSRSQLLGCKMECWSPERGDSQDITVKGFVMTCCHWLNYISPLLLKPAGFCSRLYESEFSLSLSLSPYISVRLSGYSVSHSFSLFLSYVAETRAILHSVILSCSRPGCFVSYPHSSETT